MDNTVGSGLSPSQALKDIFGRASASSVGDPFRASFRRRALRHGGIAGAITAAMVHVVTIVFLLIARGKFDAPFAFLWSIWFALPTMILHAVGAFVIGVALSLVGLFAGALIYGITRQPMISGIALAVLIGVLAAVCAALLNVQNPLLGANDGPAAFVTSLIPAIGGAVWGVLLARRLGAYFEKRSGGVTHV